MSSRTHLDNPGWSRRLVLSVAYLAAIGLFGFALAIVLLAKDRTAYAVGAFVGVTWAVPVMAIAITIAAAVGVGERADVASSRGRISGIGILGVAAVGAILVGIALASASGWSALGAALPLVVLIVTVRTAVRQIRQGLVPR
jgi:hypothetical protein